MRPAAALVAAFVAVSVAGLSACGTPQQLAPGTQLCIGMPAAKCAMLLEQLRQDRAITAARYELRCVSPTCTMESGQASVVIEWSDETRQVLSVEWGP